MSDGTTAFVPGHVTGFFTVRTHDDPAKAGSRGAGIALSDGVAVDVVQAPAGTERVTLNGDTVDVAAVDFVLDELGVTARVAAETELPLGAGFGVSGALALGTALAASVELDRPHTENELVDTAHRADVEANTGLGDVVGQAHGGLAVRLAPGAPPHGSMDRVLSTSRVEYVTFGERSTESVLAGDTGPIDRAGERALERLLDDPTGETFVAASRQFAEDAGLLTDRLESVLEDVRETGRAASMAMLGETAFAIGDGLSSAGYDTEVCEIDRTGARVSIPFD